MAKDHYGAQAYRQDGQGRLERGQSEACRDADQARRRAELLACKRGVAGATAFLIPNYTREYGGDDPITIAVYGEVPPEARDALPF